MQSFFANRLFVLFVITPTFAHVKSYLRYFVFSGVLASTLALALSKGWVTPKTELPNTIFIALNWLLEHYASIDKAIFVLMMASIALLTHKAAHSIVHNQTKLCTKKFKNTKTNEDIVLLLRDSGYYGVVLFTNMFGRLCKLFAAIFAAYGVIYFFGGEPGHSLIGSTLKESELLHEFILNGLFNCLLVDAALNIVQRISLSHSSVAESVYTKSGYVGFHENSN